MSLTNCTVLLPQSRDSSHHVSEAKCSSQPIQLLLLHRVDSTDHPSMSGVTWLYPMCILATDVLFKLERFHKNTAPPPLWLQKSTDLHVHNFTHCPHLWHEPWLTNCGYTWSWRLCGITRTVPCIPLLFHGLLFPLLIECDVSLVGWSYF